jgi:hypothetical protein
VARHRYSLLVVGLALFSSALAQTPSGDLVRVLFLGNSLTAGNDVPGLVQEMARQQGVIIECVGVAPGGYDLSDHWNAGHASMLTSGMYDVLVLQQGPSTQADSQVHLREWTVHWAGEARRHGLQPALYMPWPVRTQTNGFALVSQSYRNAATAADIRVFATGESWQQALQANPNLGLYSSDDFHATPAGSFLAAMVIGRGLFSLDPARVQSGIGNASVNATQLATFRAVVAALPANTISGLTGPTNPPPAPAPPAPPPASSPAPAGSGGGGAPSGAFLLALAGLAWLRRKYSTRQPVGGIASIE